MPRQSQLLQVLGGVAPAARVIEALTARAIVRERVAATPWRTSAARAGEVRRRVADLSPIDRAFLREVAR